MNESDWKLYSALRPVAHERMCIRIMEEVERTVLDKSLAPYDRIEASEELLKAGKRSCTGRLGFSGSRAMRPVLTCWGCVPVSWSRLRN